MRRVFHKRSDIKFEPQSTIFVVICWKAVKVAVCMFEETSAYFNGTVKQLSLLVHRVLVFIIRVKCRREHLTQVTRLSLERDRIFISKFTYFRRYIERFLWSCTQKFSAKGFKHQWFSLRVRLLSFRIYYLIYRFSSTLDFYHSRFKSKYIAIQVYLKTSSERRAPATFPFFLSRGRTSNNMYRL